MPDRQLQDTVMKQGILCDYGRHFNRVVISIISLTNMNGMLK